MRPGDWVPNQNSMLSPPIVGGGVQRLQGGVGPIRRLVGGSDHLRRLLHGRLDVTFIDSLVAGLVEQEQHFLADILAVARGHGTQVPLRVQCIQAFLRRPVVGCGHHHRIVQRDHLFHAVDRERRFGIHRAQRSAGHRWWPRWSPRPCPPPACRCRSLPWPWISPPYPSAERVCRGCATRSAA